MVVGSLRVVRLAAAHLSTRISESCVGNEESLMSLVALEATLL